MEKIKSIIIDDEAASLRSLKYEINKYCPDIEILNSFQDPELAINFIRNNDDKADLLFLDIEMPKINGFQLLESLTDINFDVIFVTAYDEFAVRAFEFNALDYLLKPILKDRLIQSVQKVKEKRGKLFSKSDLKALVNNIQRRNPASPSENLAIPTKNGFEFISISEIQYLEAESNYTWVRMNAGRQYLVSRSLKDVKRMISSSKFVRVHKSYVINISYVRKYIKGRGGIIELKEGNQIPVSRTYADQLKEALNI